MGKKGKPPKAKSLKMHDKQLDDDEIQKDCTHYTYEGTVHLKKALLSILASTRPLPCQLCQQDMGNKDSTMKSNNNAKKKKKKKKGSAAANANEESKVTVFVCLSCNGYFCAIHSRTHANETQHWWTSKQSDPSTVYCLKCDREVQKVPSLAEDEIVTIAPMAFVIQGLPHVGYVSCCFNAILQIMLSLKLVRKQILELDFPRTASMTIALKELFVATNGSKHRSFNQDNLLSKVSSIHPGFTSTSSYMDVKEMFSGFIHALHSEQKESWAGVSKAVDFTFVDYVFGGACSVVVSCEKCSHKFVEDEEFVCLSLPVTVTEDGCLSLEDYLGLFTNTQPWPCERCSTAKEECGDAARTIVISVAPPVLAIHLKRPKKEKDQSQSQKLTQKLKTVRYTENVDLSPFMEPRSSVNGNNDTKYKLVGVVQYSETSAHYVANLKAKVPNLIGSLGWYYAKDEEIVRTKSKLFEDEPQLLFYERLVPNNVRKEDMKVIQKINKDKKNAAAEEEKHSKEHALKKNAAAEEEKHEEEKHSKHSKEPPLDQLGPELKTPAPNIIRGLPNLDTMCFFNSILQVLLSIDPLRTKMLGDIWTGPLAMSLKELFVETSILNSASDPLNQMKVFRTMCSVSTLKDGTMEDSHEFLRIFLNYLQEEELNTRQDLSEDTTVINSVFGGTLSSIVSSIQSSHSSTKCETFLDISLPIPSGSLPVAIENCWVLYTEQEPLNSQWLCSDCTTAQGEPVNTNAMKKIFIASAPPVLVVSLKRFTYSIDGNDIEKLQESVLIKEMFDLQPFMEQRSMEMKTLYRLVGVVQHIGNPIGGHYIAYVRGANKMESQEHQNGDSKSWFCANDKSIRKVSLDEVLKCQAYLLFYERCFMGEESQPADINMQPYSSARIVDEERADINIQAHPLAHTMAEESQLANIIMQYQTSGTASDLSPLPLDEVNMQCQTSASATASDLSTLPLDEVHPWEFQKTRNKEQKRLHAIAMNNDSIGQMVMSFLNRFILEGDIKPFYQCEFVNMCERGSGSQGLNIGYFHLLKYSKRLAMDVCNRYKSLKVNLKEAAIRFAEQTLDANLNHTDW